MTGSKQYLIQITPTKSCPAPLTLIFDFNKKFTSYLAGYPGACHDTAASQLSSTPKSR
ncbi:hypothetical protein VP01_1981g7 [Puccinia sorghi]|uniref:Uncharacterized protein n=1 Tax=Puccinia sorghi TaxID=27349 RepID=A0A0L6VBQ3_9BASI|nr:hypothetical protein VP01_1981g7 [Puccinia sorghi]